MTDRELVEIAKDIYENVPTVYAKGGIGWKLTTSRYAYLYKQYDWNKEHFNSTYFGKCACDCSGFIVGTAYDGWRKGKDPVWTKAHDWNDQMLGDRLTDCVKPSDAKPGMCLWKQGHVGLYIGDGFTLDANWENNGKLNGLIKRKLSDVKWEKAGKLPEIDYTFNDIQVGDVVPMEVYEIKDGFAYGKVSTVAPAPKPTIKVGSIVTINPGAKCGGLTNRRGDNVDPRYANGKYQDVVSQIATHKGVEEALLNGIVTWVATSSLTLV